MELYTRQHSNVRKYRNKIFKWKIFVIMKLSITRIKNIKSLADKYY